MICPKWSGIPNFCKKTPASKVFCPLDFEMLVFFLRRFSDFWRLHQKIELSLLADFMLTLPENG